MSDEKIETGGGSVVRRDVDAQEFIGRDQRHGGSNITFQSQDNAQLWGAIISLSNQLADMQDRLNDKIGVVAIKLDGLPDRVNKLEIKVPPIFTPIFWVLIFLCIIISTMAILLVLRVL